MLAPKLHDVAPAIGAGPVRNASLVPGAAAA
ncbi:MAG: hypothetical protein QOK41_1794 [Sphingomonadales bacterium]|jgi:hypothetical protein|nr:hypothetical protein [Sphingomonadales bacterium]